MYCSSRLILSLNTWDMLVGSIPGFYTAVLNHRIRYCKYYFKSCSDCLPPWQIHSSHLSWTLVKVTAWLMPANGLRNPKSTWHCNSAWLETTILQVFLHLCSIIFAVVLCSVVQWYFKFPTSYLHFLLHISCLLVFEHCNGSCWIKDSF
jgi:hypothetical protein